MSGMMSPFCRAALRAGLQSGSIMCVADVTSQVVVEGRSIGPMGNSGYQQNPPSTPTGNECVQYDPKRTMRWVAAGLLLHGPWNYAWFSKIDQFFGCSKRMGNVVKKVATVQFLMLPPYLVVFFSFMGAMEGMPSEDIKLKIQDKWPESYLFGCVFWPILNCVNFAIVPPMYRVPYVATSGCVWNSFLSWTNSRDDSEFDIQNLLDRRNLVMGWNLSD